MGARTEPHTYGSQHAAVSSSRRDNGTSRATAIDLTSTPPHKQPRKRKQIDDADEGNDTPAKKRKKTTRAKDEEKRLKRFRPHEPVAYRDIEHRALTQRMFVIDRQRHEATRGEGAPVAHPTETIRLAGTTGNLYTVTIDRVPRCDCPQARKGHAQCKHIVYVLARVLRARRELQYQLALLSTELVEIFAGAPALPGELGPAAGEGKGNRKAMEGECCPICMEDFDGEDAEGEQIVYCRASCGNNMHRDCFAQWSRARPDNVTCPFCRQPWEADDDESSRAVRKTLAAAKTGGVVVNEEGYVNVAGQLGLSGRRDYSTYHEYWVRRRGYD